MADEAALKGPDGRTIDASLEQHVRTVERRRREARAKWTTDPRSAAHVARLILEEIAFQLHLREIGPTTERELDKVLKRLVDRGIIPRKEGLHAGTVQIHGNFWVHKQLDTDDPTARDLETLLTALDLVVKWYFTDYLGLDISGVVPFEERAAPEPPLLTDTTPATIATMTGTMGTGWLEGALVPIWRGRRGTDAGRLQVTIPDGDSMRVVELRVAGSTASYIGREPYRSDKTTPNDLVIPDPKVSRDQAVVQVVDNRVLLQNTSGKANVAAGSRHLAPDWIPPGASRPLHHRAPVRFGNVAGVFLDSRFYEAAPESAVDPVTGLLAREGLTFEVALTLAGRKQKHAFFARYSPDDEATAALAALLLHEREPLLAAARLRNVAVLVSDGADGMEARLQALERARLRPTVAGTLPLQADSTQADARIEAALGALARLAAAGGSSGRAVDLKDYAIPTVSLDEITLQAKGAYSVGGGITVFVLEEVERLRQLGHNAYAAIELEFREMIGGVLGPADRISHISDGIIAVLTTAPAEQFAREQAAAWHARGPVQIGQVELDRCARTISITRESLPFLQADGLTFIREAASGIDTRALPTPIAYYVEQAMRGADPGTRLQSIVRALEHIWKLLAAILVAAHRQQFPRDQLPHCQTTGWGQPWATFAASAAADLIESDGHIGALARATNELSKRGGWASAEAAAASALMILRSSTASQEVLEGAFDQAQEALRATLAALTPLRGWALIAVRATEALDFDGRSLRVDYSDFRGPHASGSSQRICVNGLPVHAFVYLARWHEGMMIVLDPWVRRARNPTSGADELFFIDEWPTAAGRHTYRAAAGGEQIALEVSPRHLGR